MGSRADQIVALLPRLRRYALALVRDPDRAEDLVQETVARALSRIHFWRTGTNLRAWLFTIMHNQFANDCRRISRTPAMVPLDEHGERSASPAFAESGAEVSEIEHALMRLPAEQRSTLLLVSLEGLSYTETARVLKVRTGTVMSRLHRARETLRDLLDVPRPDEASRRGPVRRVK